MVDKYYQPSIEELFVGYEYEEIDNYGIWKQMKIEKEDYWADIHGDSVYQDMVSDLQKGKVRTKYLTKEDIESLGWEQKEYEHVKPKKYFKKRQYVLTQLPENKIIIGIYQSEIAIPYTLYHGYCPSKNELKYLSKLLNIE